MKRLKLVEELIRRHGRAYDYRVLTVKELETILAKLDQLEKQKEPAPVADGNSAQEASPAFTPKVGEGTL